MESLTEWLAREYDYAAAAMLVSVSAVGIVKSRPGFGQTIRPKRGSIVASPVLGAYDPDPDYFFHWFRDSAVVMDAIRLLYEAGGIGTAALTHLKDFTRFTLSLAALDGRVLIAAPEWRKGITADFVQYTRIDTDLAAVYGPAIAAETRVNPNGMLDISKWNRPQHDGAAMRALTLMRWWRAARAERAFADAAEEIATLIRADLAFTFSSWRQPSFDIWEEELGQHYYTLCVAGAALSEGSVWLEGQGGAFEVRSYREAAQAIHHALEGFWNADDGYYRSRVLASGERSTKELDIAVILAAIHTAEDRADDLVNDPRMHATLAKLEALFDEAYLINRNRPPGRGVAMGRYAGDTYYSGGAYFFSTLGAAEFCFRAAAGASDAARWIERGDAFLATVQAFTPAGGELSEQFDQRTGAQTSAKHLAWSYAALISCATARRAVAGTKARAPR
jgi:GH15 family glucan-1,4-alpha-glucosidase